MTLIDWRKNPERLSLAMDVLNQSTMREMLLVMETDHPMRSHRPVVDGFGATNVLGFIDGFQFALDMLRSFAEPLPSASDEVTTTWGVDLPDPNQK